jgi:hypothetical protein
MQNNPDAAPHMARAAELAESFEPILCRVIDTFP